MNIAIIMLPERGGYYATFLLARALVRRGHRVVYYGTADFAEDVRRQGFEYVTMFQDEYGPGTLDLPPVPDGFFARLRFTKQLFRRMRPHRFLEATVSGEVERLLRSHAVDIILVDPLLRWLGAPLARAGFRVMSLSTELIGDGFSLPPTSSGFVPREGSVTSSIWCRVIWVAHLAQHYSKLLFRRVLSAVYSGDAPPLRLTYQLWKRSSGSGYPRFLSEYGIRHRFPEIVLCPRAFDFPSRAPVRRRYAGLTVEVDRQEVDFPWERLDRLRGAIVYVSLGTHAALYVGKTSRFLRTVLDVARQRTDLRFVLVLGVGRSVNDIGDVPENVVAVQFVPQIALLKRASVAVTNGGLGTIKECVLLRVPMIVVPCMYDQPGNAARVAFHGIGRRADIRKISARALGGLIDECRQSEAIKQALRRMSTAFASTTETEAALDFVLGHPGPEPGPAAPLPLAS